jgi:hypothetical protein
MAVHGAPKLALGDTEQHTVIVEHARPVRTCTVGSERAGIASRGYRTPAALDGEQVANRPEVSP